MKNPLEILIAVDSFKGSLTTGELSCAVEEGIRMSGAKANITSIPMADGGEGTCETLLEGLGGRRVSVAVTGPLFEALEACYVILDDNTAVIEMSAAAGLPLVPEEKRNPAYTTSYGVGELIKDAIQRGCRNFILGIGGSATNDGGIGMLSSLGFKFLDTNGEKVLPVGASLGIITSTEQESVTAALGDCHFLVACDVDNPLYGEKGAAAIFGPQKGADAETIRLLDSGLKNYARIIEKFCGKKVDSMPGAGAAGGLGAGCYAFLNAELKPGVDIIIDYLHVEKLVQKADIIFTGEGRLDAQSVMGKAPSGIARLGALHNKPVIGIAGIVSEDATRAHDYGMSAMFSIIDSPMSLEMAMDKENARRMVSKTVQQLMRLILSLRC